mgnify:CR=1 FL=1
MRDQGRASNGAETIAQIEATQTDHALEQAFAIECGAHPVVGILKRAEFRDDLLRVLILARGNLAR